MSRDRSLEGGVRIPQSSNVRSVQRLEERIGSVFSMDDNDKHWFMV